MSMERYAEALGELEVVRDNVPKESAVYFLMGKVRYAEASENCCVARGAAGPAAELGVGLPYIAVEAFCA